MNLLLAFLLALITGIVIVAGAAAWTRRLAGTMLAKNAPTAVAAGTIFFILVAAVFIAIGAMVAVFSVYHGPMP